MNVQQVVIIYKYTTQNKSYIYIKFTDVCLQLNEETPHHGDRNEVPNEIASTEIQPDTIDLPGLKYAFIIKKIYPLISKLTYRPS